MAPDPPRNPPPARLPDTGRARTAFTGGIAVGVVALACSFRSFYDLGERIGLTGSVFLRIRMSHLLPVTVDLLAVVATVVLTLGGITAATRDYAKRVALAAIVTSLAANAAEHVMAATMTPGAPADGWMAVITLIVGAIPPASAAVVVHLLVTVQADRAAAAQAAADAAQAATDEQARRDRDRQEKRQRTEARRTSPPPVAPLRVPAPPVTGPVTAPDRPAPDQPPPTGKGGAAIRAAILDALAARTPFTEINATALAKAAGVAPQRGRAILAEIRVDRMLAYLADRQGQGVALADVLPVELVREFGCTERVAAETLDAYASGKRATTTAELPSPAATTSEGS